MGDEIFFHIPACFSQVAHSSKQRTERVESRNGFGEFWNITRSKSNPGRANSEQERMRIQERLRRTLDKRIAH